MLNISPVPAPSSFSYDVKSHRSQLSIPGVRCDLADSTPEGIAKIAEVTYKIEKVAVALRKHLESIAPEENGGEAKDLENPQAPSIGHDETYKDFVHGLRLEQYANISAARNLYNSLSACYRVDFSEFANDESGLVVADGNPK